MLRRMLVARLNLDLQHQPQIGQYVAVIGMRGPARLLGIVADHRSFLMAVERFHRRVDIENPWFAQQRPGAIVELLLQPGSPRFRLDLAQCPTDRVLADHLGHPKQWWIDRVAAQRRDVGVAPMPGQHRQQHCSQYVPLRRRVRARQRQRAPRNPAVKQPALLQVFNEKRKLAKRGYRCPSPFSHSTWTRPANVSAITDRSLPHSTDGCSPAGCREVTARSVLMPLRLHGFADFANYELPEIG